MKVVLIVERFVKVGNERSLMPHIFYIAIYAIFVTSSISTIFAELKYLQITLDNLYIIRYPHLSSDILQYPQTSSNILIYPQMFSDVLKYPKTYTDVLRHPQGLRVAHLQKSNIIRNPLIPFYMTIFCITNIFSFFYIYFTFYLPFRFYSSFTISSHHFISPIN